MHETSGSINPSYLYILATSYEQKYVLDSYYDFYLFIFDWKENIFSKDISNCFPKLYHQNTQGINHKILDYIKVIVLEVEIQLFPCDPSYNKYHTFKLICTIRTLSYVSIQWNPPLQMTNFRIKPIRSSCFSKPLQCDLKSYWKFTVLTVQEKLLHASRTVFWSEQNDIPCVSQLLKFSVMNVWLLVKLRNFAYLFVLLLFAVRILYCLLNRLGPVFW